MSLPAQIAQVQFAAASFGKNDFANLKVTSGSLLPLKLDLAGSVEKVEIEDMFGKSTVSFKPTDEDAAELKELEYALQRYVGENEMFDKENVIVRPLNHEKLWVKWPTMKNEKEKIGLEFVDKKTHFKLLQRCSLEDLFKNSRTDSFQTESITVRVSGYLRKMEDGSIQAGLYFVLDKVVMPKTALRKK